MKLYPDVYEFVNSEHVYLLFIRACAFTCLLAIIRLISPKRIDTLVTASLKNPPEFEHFMVWEKHVEKLGLDN